MQLTGVWDRGSHSSRMPFSRGAPDIQEICIYDPCHGNGGQECLDLVGFC